MDLFKSLFLSVISVIFAGFCIYSYKISKEFEKLEKKSKEPRKVKMTHTVEIMAAVKPAINDIIKEIMLRSIYKLNKNEYLNTSKYFFFS
ncbi:MAG: hypothetical protein HZC47_08395 [Methanobacterium sp.]|uniref:hypothetical protein n=1 Tax=Methanobacterium sp. TaxID=2164 RepID=UPI003D64B94B|nr:hypothetical protein [Methanobacterium sp.]